MAKSSFSECDGIERKSKSSRPPRKLGRNRRRESRNLPAARQRISRRYQRKLQRWQGRKSSGKDPSRQIPFLRPLQPKLPVLLKLQMPFGVQPHPQYRRAIRRTLHLIAPVRLEASHNLQAPVHLEKGKLCGPKESFPISGANKKLLSRSTKLQPRRLL